MHNIYNLLQYYNFLRNCKIRLFLQIWIVMKEVGVGNIVFS